jgi:hypothetical protein
MTHCPARARTRRPLYRSSPVTATARPYRTGATLVTTPRTSE